MPSFLQPSGTFFPVGGVAPTIMAPTTGSTVVMSRGQSAIYLSNGATLAALTVKLPPNPAAGQSVMLIPSGAITSLTVQTAAGGAISGAPTAGVAFTEIHMRFLNNAWVWVK